MPPKIDGDRLWRRVEALAAVTDPAVPYTRRSFSPLHAKGRDLVRGWFAEEAGLAVRLDTVANLIGRVEGTDAGRLPLMAGSHSDTVPGGGRFDGIAGLLTALEAAQALKDAGHRLRHPFEVVDFLSEEPSEYGMSCVGSRLMAGRLTRGDLDLARADGETLAEGIRRMGGDPDRIAEAVRAPGSIAGYLELHIEQGRVLEERRLGVGVVSAIVGITRYAITVDGRADHAGATPMDLRHDALTAASRLVVKAEEDARALNRDGVYFVATVGRMTVAPNAANVVPGRVDLIVEYRSGSDVAMNAFIAGLKRYAEQVAAASGTRIAFDFLSDAPPALCADVMRDTIREACAATGTGWMDMASGAGHDAMHAAAAGPMGMIFIPCREGRSHCPEEWVEPKDLAVGAAVFLETLLRLDARLD